MGAPRHTGQAASTRENAQIAEVGSAVRGGAHCTGLRTVIESLYAACDENTAKAIEGGGSLEAGGAVWRSVAGRGS